MGRRSALAAVAVAALTVAAASATGDDVGMLLPGERFASTLAAGDRKTVGFAGVEGASLRVRATAARKGGLKPRLSLLAPDGAAVDVGDPKPSGSAAFRIARLGATGTWRIGVEAADAGGGAFVLSTSSKTPLRAKWRATLDASAAAADHVVPAAPGGAIAVSVVATGRPRFDPTVDVIAPSGAVVAHVVGARGRAALRGAPLHELGRYVVRVTGGVGSFAATAAVTPARRRRPTYRDVESRPEVRGISPPTTTNQNTLVLRLDGVGFDERQFVSLADGVVPVVTGQVSEVESDGATAVLDLADVAPGEYVVRVSTPAGNGVAADDRIVVTNRTPIVVGATPRDVVSTGDVALEVHGVGFDAAASVFLRGAGGGAPLPFVVTGRAGHESIAGTATVAPYVTGPCEIEVRDPDGAGGTATDALDVLGLRSAPTAVRTYSAGDAARTFFVTDAAYDEVHGRVLFAVLENAGRAAFVLFDPATQTVVDTLEIKPADLGNVQYTLHGPRVAWDRVSDTFAVCVESPAFVRVVSATDLHQTVAQAVFAQALRIDVDAGAGGGYLVVCDQPDGPAPGMKIMAQPISAAGVIDAAKRVVLASSALGYVWRPAVAHQGAGRFVVAWAGVDHDEVSYAVHAAVVDSEGRPADGATPFEAASESFWTTVDFPELARDPVDGSMLLAFMYGWNLAHPACVRLAPGDATPGAWTALDGGLADDAGEATSVVWNPARAEFVAAYLAYDGRTVIRRVRPDGALRGGPAYFEGVEGVLYVGAAADSLGFARATDGVADGVFDAGTTVMRVLAGPMR